MLILFHLLQANSTINFTILNYNLHGSRNEMRPMKLSDMNICNQYAAPVNVWQENVKFPINYFSKCTINLREYVSLHPDMTFSTIFINYYENQANFLQTVPILIRNAFKDNEVGLVFIPQ